jgi:streptogramin lyase
MTRIEGRIEEDQNRRVISCVIRLHPGLHPRHPRTIASRRNAPDPGTKSDDQPGHVPTAALTRPPRTAYLLLTTPRRATMRSLLASLLLLLAFSTARADKLVLVAGGGEGGDGAEATKAKLIQPFGVDFGPNGGVFIVEMAKGERLRGVTVKGELITLAGKAGEKGFGGNDGSGIDARFNGMHSLAVGPKGTIYLADTWNNCVRTFDPGDGKVRAFAGTGEKGFSGDDGPAKSAKFGGIYCVSFDPELKNLYLTDLDNKRIRKVDMKTGIVTTVAGNGQRGVPKDGEDATKQPLIDPRAHAVDKDGNLWILERGGHALRVVDKNGKIRTVAGTGKALESAMNGPKHLSIDRDGTVLIADTENHRVVRFNPKDNTITPVAGTGKKGKTMGDGDPLKAEFNQPHGVIVHPKTGDIYISDASNGRVLKIVRE